MRGGATDNAQLRAKGVDGYGFGPVVDEQETHGAHSEDERMLETSVAKLAEFLWCTVVEVAAARRGKEPCFTRQFSFRCAAGLPIAEARFGFLP